jgi:hypothetical protein
MLRGSAPVLGDSAELATVRNFLLQVLALMRVLDKIGYR